MKSIYISKAFFIATCVFITFHGRAQQENSTVIQTHPELNAFDFLIGKWQTSENIITNRDTIVRGPSEINIYKAGDGFSLLEDWIIKNNDSLIFKATVHRIYDGIAKSWVLNYSDNKLNFQVWQGKKEKDYWEFSRERYQNGKKIIVKLKWIKLNPSSAQQLIERSFDDGKTWTLGSIINYKKIHS